MHVGYLRDVELRVDNLTNSKDLAEDMIARAVFTAKAMKTGQLQGRLAIDPYAAKPSFDVDLKLAGVQLTQLNDFFRAFAGIDVQKGTLRVIAELEAKDGHFDGYIKPFFEDVDVLSADEADEQGFLDTIWEAVVGATAGGLALVADQRQQAADLDRVVLLGLDLQQGAGDGGGDLGVDLVGGDLEERLVDRDGVAHLLQPAGDGALGDGLAQCREGDFGGHEAPS